LGDLGFVLAVAKP